MIGRGLFLGGSNGTLALLSLARNVALARLVSVEDFGIAATFAIAMAAIEMASNLAIDRLIIQARDGDRAEIQRSAQLLQFARGLVGALLLFALAGPVSRLFDVSDLTPAFQMLAAIPLLRGLAHLDMFRFQRTSRFGPWMIVELVSLGVATAAIFPLALWLGDYRAMLYSLLLHQSGYALISHIVAERRYGWRWDGKFAVRTVRFGLPLLINGALVFAIFHGERVVVGGRIGMTELALFSAVFSLSLVPAQVLLRTLQPLLLPRLAGARDDPERFRKEFVAAIEGGLLAALFLVAVFAVFGPPVFALLYGDRYAPAIWAIPWLALMQAIRIARAGPNVVAISKGETLNPMLANIPRALAVPAAWVAAGSGYGLATVIGFAIAGEVLALVAAFALLRGRLNLPLQPVARAVALTIIVLSVSAASALIWPPTPAMAGYPQIIAVLGFALAAISMVSFRQLARRTTRRWIAAPAPGRHDRLGAKPGGGD